MNSKLVPIYFLHYEDPFIRKGGRGELVIGEAGSLVLLLGWRYSSCVDSQAIKIEL